VAQVAGVAHDAGLLDRQREARAARRRGRPHPRLGERVRRGTDLRRLRRVDRGLNGREVAGGVDEAGEQSTPVWVCASPTTSRPSMVTPPLEITMAIGRPRPSMTVSAALPAVRLPTAMPACAPRSVTACPRVTVPAKVPGPTLTTSPAVARLAA
jgi:hypothetical protein